MNEEHIPSLNDYLKKQRAFVLKSRMRLLFLAFVLVLLWFLPRRWGFSSEEMRLWNDVRQAELYIWQLREDQQIGAGGADPWKLGLIGVEWSPLSTTLGSLESKRTACHPGWSVAILRKFDSMGLKEGDPVAILSSSSFPGLLLNALKTAEYRKLNVLLIVSLGSSTWGANVPEIPWPIMAEELRKNGLLHTKANYYTLGGDDENGGGIAPEGVEIMIQAAEREGVPLLREENLEKMIEKKMNIVENFVPKLVMSIGGSHANMGNDDEILTLSGGLHLPSGRENAGDGIIGRALSAGYPVFHFLNLHDLSLKYGIPYNSSPSKEMASQKSWFFSLLGVFLGGWVLFSHRRWMLFCDKKNGGEEK